MKYVIDTNVVSEIAKPNPCENVIDWFWEYGEQAYLPSVSIEELYYGIFIMPDGKRKRAIRDIIDGIVKDLSDRTLPYDGFSAYLCAEMHANAKGIGRASSIEDYMIAAICKANNAVLVTHNVKDFDYLGIDIVDPFDYILPIRAELV